jgi:gas vesicle protein
MSSHTQSYPLRNAGVFSVGLLLGGLIGSAAMLLLAPQSGKKTRSQLEDNSVELREQVSQTVQDTVKLARGKAREIGSAVRKQTKELGQRGQEALDEQKEIASDLINAEKKAVHNIATD